MISKEGVRRQKIHGMLSAAARHATMRMDHLESRVMLSTVGLVAAYGFEESSGNAVVDTSGSNNAGTITEALRTASGRFGSALNFDGINDWVTVADSNSLDLTTGMTIEAWVFPTSASGKRDVIIKQGTNADMYNLYARTETGAPEANVFVGSSNREARASTAPVNTWTHLAGTFDGTTLRLFVNGVQATSLNAAGSITTSTGVLRIGGNSLWGEFFQGTIDEVRIYNRAISVAEIQEDMVTAIAAPSTDTSPPSVASVTPPHGASGISVSTNLDIVFSEAMNAATINGTTIELRDIGNNLIPAAVTYNATTRTATLNPTNNLVQSANFFTARVKSGVSGVKDASNNALATDFTWSFATGNPSFQNQIVINSGLTAPTVMQWLPDGRMLIGELFGQIWVVQPGATQLDSTKLLQITNINNTGVSTGAESGINGLTIDPNFSQNGYIYVFYSANSPSRDRVSRFTVTGNTASLASEVVIWQSNVNLAPDHHGGGLAFGPDGKLYITIGDQNNAGACQSLQAYNGKILRINSDGTIPTDNPFYDGAGANLDAIWALGLRNPFHFSFDPADGRMYIGDVGGNDVNNSYEEVNIGIRGANYGWPNVEGSGGGFTDPIFSYRHAGHDAAIVGGLVYHGTAYPQALQGSYIFGDYARNFIRRLTLDKGGNVTGEYFMDPIDGSFDVTSIGDPVNITVGPDGNIYYVDIGFQAVIQGVPNSGGGTTNPKIRRLVYVGSNLPPTAVAGSSTTTGQAPLTVNFSSAGSVDPEGATLSYLWNFGDGTTSTQANPTHVYSVTGPYAVQLSVSDGVHTTQATPIVIRVGTPPTATITGPTDGSSFRAGDRITFGGTGFDAEDGNLAASRFSWSVVFRHDTHIHPVLGPLTGTTSSFFDIPDTGHDFSGNVRYEILLTVTDSDNLQTTTSVTIFPEKVNLTFNTTPAGGTVLVDGLPHVGAFVLDSLVGFKHTIEAVTPQTQSGSQYNFTSWSDAGARVHQIVTPATTATYTASYTLVALAGPIAAYNFNEGSGTSAGDASGNNQNGVLNGATWITTGKYGNALNFNGTSNYVTVADSNLLDLSNALTLEAWVYPTSNTGKRDVIIKEGVGADHYNLYSRSDGGGPEANVLVNGANRIATAAALPINTWTHLSQTYDGTTLKLYVNGVLASTTVAAGAIPASAGALRIGGNSLWGEYFAGRIDDVRIYNRVLSASELATDMNTPVTSGPVNHAPVASFTTTPSSGAIPLVVQVNAAGSSDPDAGDTISYAWDLDNDGQYDDATGVTAQVTFTTSGTKTIGLRVTDLGNLSSTTTRSVVASNPNNILPVATIDSPATTTLWRVGQVISFSGHATDFENGALGASSLTWQWIMVNGGGETVVQTFTGVIGGNFTVPNTTYPSQLRLTLTATDADGGQDVESILLSPQTTTLTLGTSPAGLGTSLNGTLYTSPVTVIVGSTNTISTTSPQTLSGTNYFFSTWSDGGAISHTVTAPVSSASYTTTFVQVAGPVAAYNFNAGSGATLADQSGNGNNGTITGAAWITTGKNAGALNFTADGNIVTIPNASSLNLTTGMTLEAWVYPTINTGVRDILIKEGTNVDIYNLYHRNGAGRPEGNVFVGGTNRVAQGTAALAINTWTHLATTYDGAVLRLFVNGAQVSSTTIAGAITTSSGALRIGGNTLWGEWFRGRLDDIRIYNRALTATDIVTDMNTPVANAIQPILTSLSGTTSSINSMSEPLVDPGTVTARTKSPFSQKRIRSVDLVEQLI